MSPQEIKSIAIRNYHRVYGDNSIITSSLQDMFNGIANDVIDAASNIGASGHGGGSPFTETTTTTEFMPPDQQLWMDIAVAASSAPMPSFANKEWPAEVANATLDAFNKRFAAAKP